MALYARGDWAAAEAVAELCYTNPFTPRRIALERQALGPAYIDSQQVWSRSSPDFRNPNVPALRERTRQLLHAGHGVLERGELASADELAVHAGVVRYHLFERFDGMMPLVERIVAERLSGESPAGGKRITAYGEFRSQAERFYGVAQRFPEQLAQLPHLFATSLQASLSFSLIFKCLLGTSQAATQLRAATWESIFTHDMRRYEQLLYRRMHEIPTLVLGPSGSGKELVSRAIGLCGYVPFDGQRACFVAPLAGDLRAINLSAMSPTLIESELFGHSRGAFTGAVEERQGFFELCSEYGTVFLDEIGEISPTIQVKLLRVLQSRRFERVGEATPRSFRGRLVAATNRELAVELGAGSFRSDLFYRLCAHTIRTPSLSEQLAQAPGDLHGFVEHVVVRLLGDDERAVQAAGPVCEEVVAFIDGHLRDYSWPGNVRELEQCVRSVVVQRDYTPTVVASAAAPEPPAVDLDATLGGLEISAGALLDRYCAALYRRHGTIQAVADTLNMTRRTVRRRLENARRLT